MFNRHWSYGIHQYKSLISGSCPSQLPIQRRVDRQGPATMDKCSTSHNFCSQGRVSVSRNPSGGHPRFYQAHLESIVGLTRAFQPAPALPLVAGLALCRYTYDGIELSR